MFAMKKYFGLVLGALSLYLVLNIFPSNLIAQGNFFPLGLFNYDVRGREYLITETNEMTNIQGLHANYLTEMSYRAQPGIIDTCNDLAGAIRAVLNHDDTTGGFYYPVYDVRPDRHNSILWRYISDNAAGNIRMDSVVIFINRVYNRYQTNHAGLGGILVAHQGETHDPNHWPFIRRAGRVIQQRFGDAVRSVVIDNSTSIDWTAAALEDFFSNDTTTDGGVGYSLDVFQHEYYPFNDANPGGLAYMGDDFQNLIDGYIAGCELTRSALNASGNTHTTLEMYIQTHRAYIENTYFRRPTQAEIWLQAFLALSRNFKGIHCYVHRTAPPGSYVGHAAWYDSGLVTMNVPRIPINNTFNHQPYNNVAGLFAHLATLGDSILSLIVFDPFTWTGTPHSYITDIIDDVNDGTHPSIEVSLMDHPSNNNDYFLLVNRRCSSDNNGTPAPAQTITVRTNKTGQYQIRDLYSGELFVSNNGCFRNITIGPGRGRVFELRPIFVLSTETWDTDTVNVSSNITVPTGKTLTITANNKVKFYSATELKVQGTLNANGVMFTAAVANANPGYWSRIYFYYASAN